LSLIKEWCLFANQVQKASFVYQPFMKILVKTTKESLKLIVIISIQFIWSILAGRRSYKVRLVLTWTIFSNILIVFLFIYLFIYLFIIFSFSLFFFFPSSSYSSRQGHMNWILAIGQSMKMKERKRKKERAKTRKKE